jgi:hypothetical protein
MLPAGFWLARSVFSLPVSGYPFPIGERMNIGRLSKPFFSLTGGLPWLGFSPLLLSAGSLIRTNLYGKGYRDPERPGQRLEHGRIPRTIAMAIRGGCRRGGKHVAFGQGRLDDEGGVQYRDPLVGATPPFRLRLTKQTNNNYKAEVIDKNGSTTWLSTVSMPALSYRVGIAASNGGAGGALCTVGLSGVNF